jgi:tetratricopeptide (TPR) repeat protein
MMPNASVRAASVRTLWTRSDPFAAALGNASLLGAGYLLLGRVGLAVVSVSATAALVVAIGISEEPAWFWRIVLGLWWASQIGHAWRLASGRTRLALPSPPAPLRAVGQGVRTSTPTQRFFASAALVLVLVPVLAVRAEALRIEQNAADAYGADDCAAADAVAAALTVEQRLATGLPTARAETVRDACGKVAQAEDDLIDASTSGDVAAEFDLLEAVLDEAPQLQDEADGLVDRFVASLPERPSCEVLRIADGLVRRSAGDLPGRAEEAVREAIPDALLRCGQVEFEQGTLEEAREKFERLLEEYPDHPQAAEAEQGIDAIDAEFELEALLSLTSTVNGTPPYCDRQAPYRAAAPYDSSTPHATMLFGDPKGVESLPTSWLTTDPAEAVLIICAEYAGLGAYVESCEYEGGHTVDFYKQRIDLRLFEVRTGELVEERTIELGGSCPYFLSYYGSVPETDAVFVSETSYRDAYRPVLDP